ncbi:ABC transporter permease [Microbacterium marinilacus]|uniref:ABC transporter permease n=2 Tax=Microbacterium marinilacus TaxID=415209 RepID=A0ABP7BJD3_9MICO|nr:ABC transporter permease [Microbacterium marinilacus]
MQEQGRNEGGAATAARASAALAAVLPPVVAAAIVLLVWQAVGAAGLLPPAVLPSPARIAEQGVVEREALLGHALPTLRATLLGFGLSVAVAFAVATLLDFSRLLRRAVLPLLVVSQTLPMIALAPVVVLWFGFDLLPKVLLVAFVTFFPLVIGLLRGFESADPDAEHLLRSMGARRTTVFRLLRLPGAMPSFFSALRVSITYAVVGAIFAEYAGAVSGLGVYMQSAKHVFRTDLVLAAVVVSSLLTLTLYALVVTVERVVLPWRRIELGGTR